MYKFDKSTSTFKAFTTDDEEVQITERTVYHNIKVPTDKVPEAINIWDNIAGKKIPSIKATIIGPKIIKKGTPEEYVTTVVKHEHYDEVEALYVKLNLATKEQFEIMQLTLVDEDVKDTCPLVTLVKTVTKPAIPDEVDESITIVRFQASDKARDNYGRFVFVRAKRAIDLLK